MVLRAGPEAAHKSSTKRYCVRPPAPLPTSFVVLSLSVSVCKTCLAEGRKDFSLPLIQTCQVRNTRASSVPPPLRALQGKTGQGATRLGLRGGTSTPKRGHSGGGTGGGAGENPLGRHPEWLISADESLFSFRLNTLNRAPSDVYLHSLRANAGGGPRLQRPGLEVAGTH